MFGKINIYRTCFVLQKWIWISSSKKPHNGQTSQSEFEETRQHLCTLNSHIPYQQTSSSFHFKKNVYLTEHDIYFSEHMFILLNINLELKIGLKD